MKDPFSVEGKVTIITGGGSGIGAAMAREFTRRGAAVLIAGRTPEKLERTRDAIRKDGGRVELKLCDIADPSACDALVAEAVRVFGRLDVMINNAGGGVPRANAAEYTPEQWGESLRGRQSGIDQLYDDHRDGVGAAGNQSELPDAGTDPQRAQFRSVGANLPRHDFEDPAIGALRTGRGNGLAGNFPGLRCVRLHHGGQHPGRRRSRRSR
jgi:hypothetical protein